MKKHLNFYITSCMEVFLKNYTQLKDNEVIHIKDEKITSNSDTDCVLKLIQLLVENPIFKSYLLNEFSNELTSSELNIVKDSLFNYELVTPQETFNFYMPIKHIVHSLPLIKQFGFVQHPKLYTDYDRAIEVLNNFIDNSLGYLNTKHSLNTQGWFVKTKLLSTL